MILTILWRHDVVVISFSSNTHPALWWLLAGRWGHGRRHSRSGRGSWLQPATQLIQCPLASQTARFLCEWISLNTSLVQNLWRVTSTNPFIQPSITHILSVCPSVNSLVSSSVSHLVSPVIQSVNEVVFILLTHVSIIHPVWEDWVWISLLHW